MGKNKVQKDKVIPDGEISNEDLAKVSGGGRFQTSATNAVITSKGTANTFTVK